jgi:histone deacetylase 6
MDELSGDIYWSKDTMTAVRIAAAASRDAVSTVLNAAADGKIEHAFAIVRPPGHHCFNTPSGFCVANNVVLAARVALAAGKRVAILDWDYHFGDGTAQEFLETPSVAFCSLHCARDRHGDSTYPRSPIKGDALAKQTKGRMFNIMWDADDADSAAYIASIEHIIVPAFLKFAPDILLISAGFDALKGDTLAGMNVSPYAFYEMTLRLQWLRIPIVAVLEGGYDLTLLGRGVRSTIDGLHADVDDFTLGGTPAPQHAAVIESVEKTLQSFGVLE